MREKQKFPIEIALPKFHHYNGGEMLIFLLCQPGLIHIVQAKKSTNLVMRPFLELHKLFKSNLPNFYLANNFLLNNSLHKCTNGLSCGWRSGGYSMTGIKGSTLFLSSLSDQVPSGQRIEFPWQFFFMFFPNTHSIARDVASNCITVISHFILHMT